MRSLEMGWMARWESFWEVVVLGIFGSIYFTTGSFGFSSSSHRL
jgi:hypothetical protein